MQLSTAYAHRFLDRLSIEALVRGDRDTLFAEALEETVRTSLWFVLGLIGAGAMLARRLIPSLRRTPSPVRRAARYMALWPTVS
jgi:hypothetical protein